MNDINFELADYDIEKFKANKKYQKLIETALTLFIAHGIKKISIEEICSKSEVSKMTYYKFFKHKNDIVKHIIQKQFYDSYIKYLELMDEKISFIEKLRKLLIIRLEYISQFSENFFCDLMNNKELVEVFEEFKRQSNITNIQFLKKGQEEGVFRKSITPELFLYFQKTILNIYKDDEFINLVNEPKKRFQEMMNFIFYGLKDPNFKG